MPSFYLRRINMKRKQKIGIKWVVNPYRKDKRTGALDPIPRSPYLQKLFKEEEERFKRGDK